MRDNLRIFRLLAMTCFLLLMASSLLFYVREQVYVRPNSYFYLLSLASAIAFAQVLFFREKNFGTWVKFTFFMEVLLITMSFILTQQALYKTVLSRDPWDHWILVEEIVERGYVPPYNEVKMPYVRMPNFHLLIANGVISANVQYKWAHFLFAGFPTLVLLMLVTYLYSKKLFRGQVALISILLVAISDNVLAMVGRNIIPNSVGVALTFLIFYLVYFKNLNNNKIKFLATLLALSLVLMHTVSFTFLIWQVVVVSILTLIFKENVAKNYLIFAIVLIVLAGFEWFLYSEFYSKTLIILLKKLFVYGFDVERYESKLPISFLSVIVARLGMILYFTIAGVEILWILIQLIKKGFRDRLLLSNVVATGGIVTGVATFLTPSSGISHRFWYYGEVLSSAFVGLLVAYFVKGKNWRKIFSVIFIAFLSLLMLKANVSNDDNPLVSHYSIRTGWYDSEIQAGMFVLHNNENTPVASDWDYIARLNDLKWVFTDDHPSNPPMVGGIGWVIKATFPKSFTEIMQDSGYLFVFRKSLLEGRSFELGPRYGKIQYIPLKNNVSEILKEGILKKNTIYTSENVIIWV